MSTQLKNLSDFKQTSIPSAVPYRLGIVTAEWNAEITKALYDAAYKRLIAQGALPENIISVTVPGSYELVTGADILLQNRQLDAVMCLGCVIQGETRHFDFICQAVATGLTQISVKHGKPVIFGVLTTNDLDQAEERAGGRHGNKGDEAAVTAIFMAELQKSLT